jgi:hypothetical protein
MLPDTTLPHVRAGVCQFLAKRAGLPVSTDVFGVKRTFYGTIYWYILVVYRRHVIYDQDQTCCES